MSVTNQQTKQRTGLITIPPGECN